MAWSMSASPSIRNGDFSELKSPNGNPLSRETLYSQYYSEVYGVSKQRIRKILNNKGNTSPDYEI